MGFSPSYDMDELVGRFAVQLASQKKRNRRSYPFVV
jgi:hypothetical protein